MYPGADALPDDLAALKAALAHVRLLTQEALAKKEAALVAAAELAVARAKASEDLALIAQQKLRIAKLERQVYGQRLERGTRLVDQLEFELEEVDPTASADELLAEQALAKAVTVAAFVRKRPSARNTFPDHLPRERVVVDPPTACACCGGTRLRKLG